jgi:hypothetical protein
MGPELDLRLDMISDIKFAQLLNSHLDVEIAGTLAA